MAWDRVPIELWNGISSFLGLQDVLSLRCVHRTFPLQRTSCTSACGHALARLPAAVASLDLRKAPYSTTTWRAFFQASPTADLTALGVQHSNIPYDMLAHVARFPCLRSLVLVRCIEFPADDAVAGGEDDWRFCFVNSVVANLPSLQHLVLRDNQLWVSTSQVLQLLRKLQHLDLSYNVLVHDVDAFPKFCSRCHVLKLDYLFFGKSLFTAFLNAVRFPVLRDLAVVSCAEDMASCLAGTDLRSLQTLTIHRDPNLPLLLPNLPNLEHLSAGRMWSYADLPQPLGCTMDVGLTDIRSSTVKPTKIVRLVLEHPTEDAAAFLIHQCPHLQYLDTSSWSASSMYTLIRQLFLFEKRLPIKCWKTSYLQDAAAHAYYLYISECPNVTRIHRVVPSHPGLFADAFFPPNHFFHSIVHLNLSSTVIQADVCIELFTWLYCGSFRNLATLDLSGNGDLDDSVFQFLRLPSSFRHFSFAYQDTSATPWSLFDLLHAHPPHAFSRVSAMNLNDSIVQIKSVLYAIGHGHLSSLPRHLALPELIHSQLPKYIVKQLNQHCCEVVAIHDA
jgi:hypothetical protein